MFFKELCMNQLSNTSIKFYDEIQWSLFNYACDGVPSIYLVKSNVLNEDMKRKSQDSSSKPVVLVTESKGRNMNYYSDNRDQSRSNSKNRYKVVDCYNRGKKRHK
jgi:hypothetical protein